MKMSLLPRLALALLFVPAAFPQSMILLEKTALNLQVNSSGAQAGAAYGFPSFTVMIQTPAAATFTPPGLAAIAVPFSANNSDYELDAAFATKAAMDAAYPNGSYPFTTSGFPAVTIPITGDLYPALPQVTGGTWQNNVLVVNPAASATLNFSPFATYTSTTGGQIGSVMTFKLQSNGTDNVNLKQQISSLAISGLTQAASAFTSYTIPAGTLHAGDVYFCTLQYDSLIYLNQTVISGGLVGGLYQNGTAFYVVGQSATPPAAPAITLQPGNVAGPLGSNVAITANFSPAGTNNPGPNTTSFDWFFNGQPVNQGSSKYTVGPNATLTVNNVTAADVGTYVLQVFNASGLASSNAATLTIGAPTGLPIITSQPSGVPITINGTASGTTVVLAVVASNASSYQWRVNGANVTQGNASGATGPTLLLSGASALNAGVYACVVSNPNGSVTSTTTQLNSVLNPPSPGRLGNLSVLTSAGNSPQPLTVGFVVGGAGTSGTQTLLIRGDGPMLAAAPFSIATAMADPVVTLFSGSVQAAQDDNWSANQAAVTTAEANTFAYPLTVGSKDAALVSALPPGNYSVQVTGNGPGGAGTGVGMVLAEVYDDTPSGAYTVTTPRLGNLSCLAQVMSGNNLTAGFVVGGTTAKTVLIRASGPALAVAPFNLTGTMPDPQLTVHTSVSGADQVLASNTGWGGNAQITAVANSVYAFSWTNPSSNDSAVLLTLNPGSYTAQVSSASGTQGTTLVEVYEVP